jgi:hypothetical protein
MCNQNKSLVYNTTLDAERAMWTMILGHAALKPLHPEAHAWLVAYGHAEDAAVLGGKQKQQAPHRTGTSRGKTQKRKPQDA